MIQDSLTKAPEVSRFDPSSDVEAITVELTSEQVEEINEWFNPMTGVVEREPYPGFWGFEDDED